MELLETLLSDKKTLIIMAAIYIVVVIVVLLFIWWPDSVPEIAKYEPYNEQEKSVEMMQYYLQKLQEMKYIYSASDFSKVFDNNYLYYSNMTVEDAASVITGIDTNFSVNSFNKYIVGNSLIYSAVVPSDNKNIQVNIVEEYYPYNFHVTFGTYVDYSELTKYGDVGEAQINIVGTYSDLNYVEYSLKIKNESEGDMIVDLSNSNKIYLMMKDGSKIYLDVVHSNQEEIKLEPGGEASVTLRFNIDVTSQQDIQSLNLYSVKLGTKGLSVKIDI